MPNGRARIAVTAGLWVVFAAAPLAVDDWQLTQLAQLMTYGIFAMSLAFIWGQIGLLCFGQAIFFGIGGYAMAVVTKGMLPGLPESTALGLVAAVRAVGIHPDLPHA